MVPKMRDTPRQPSPRFMGRLVAGDAMVDVWTLLVCSTLRPMAHWLSGWTYR
jgi:hypothetical protein